MATRRRFLALATAALLLSSIESWGLTTTIGGRRIDLDGAFELRGAFRADDQTARDKAQEMLRLRFAAEITDWLSFDASLVGLNGIVIKSHGGADALAFQQAIHVARVEAEKGVPDQIRELLSEQVE